MSWDSACAHWETSAINCAELGRASDGPVESGSGGGGPVELELELELELEGERKKDFNF